MNATYLEPAMVPATLRGNYNGKKFKAIVCLETTIPSDAGIWSGGTRDYFSFIKLATGEQIAMPGQGTSPWNAARRDITVKLEPGFAVVRHTMFCGKDMGLTFYVHPDNAAKLLPAPAAELSENEKLVLQATCSYKASYNGQDRYSMATRGMDNAPSRWQWDNAKALLIAKGLLDKRGAVTVAGRNARPARY